VVKSLLEAQILKLYLH